MRHSLSRSLLSRFHRRPFFLGLGLLLSALVAAPAVADDPAAEARYKRALDFIKNLRDTGELAGRADEGILGDLEAAGSFDGEFGDRIRAKTERFLAKARLAKPVERPVVRHEGAALNLPEVEPNNSIATANPISCDTFVCAPIQVVGDLDYYKFTLTAPGFIVLRTDPCDGDTTITLYNSAGTQIGFDNDTGIPPCSLLAMNLAPGNYSVKIAQRTNSATLNYTLGFHCTLSPPPETEPNGSIAQADPLACNGSYDATIDPAGDADWYRIDLATRQMVTVQTFDSDDDMLLALYDSSGNFLDFDDDDGVDLNASLTRALFAGTYYVQVREYLDDDQAAYIVEALCSPLPNGDVEPNGTIATASPVACGTPRHGDVTPAGDLDYYSFTLAAAGVVRATTECDGDAVVRLFDSGGMEIASAAGGPGVCASVVESLAAGTYAISVEENGLDATLAYTLLVTCAQSIACASTTPGAISPVGETDHYALTLATDSFVTLTAGCNGDGEMTVTDSSGRRVGFDDDGTGLCPRVILDLAAGAYFVAVNEAGNDATMTSP